MENQSLHLRHVVHQMEVLSSCYGVIFVHPGVKINGSYYQVITISWVVHFLENSVVLYIK